MKKQALGITTDGTGSGEHRGIDFSTSFGAQSYGAIAKAYIVPPPSEPERYEHQEIEIC